MARRLPRAALGAFLVLLIPPPLVRAQEATAPPPASSRKHHHTATATGTMAAYDPDTRQLTVSSVSGSTVYRLANDARVWLGNHRLPVVQLKSRVGSQVTVSWSDADGVPTSHTVRVAVEGQK